jgi:hypothetical protein
MPPPQAATLCQRRFYDFSAILTGSAKVQNFIDIKKRLSILRENYLSLRFNRQLLMAVKHE